jgi:HEAT repeats
VKILIGVQSVDRVWQHRKQIFYQPTGLRPTTAPSTTSSWLGDQKAGKRAAAAITDAIQNDPETDGKKKAVFALSQLPKDQSVPRLIHVAETNTNPAVRKEAYFWLRQSQNERALAYFEQVLKR